MPAVQRPLLVLFDIDGTLLSAGRVARESILVALERAYGWRIEPEHWDRSRHDFSGKTDPQIVRELVSDSVGRQRCEAVRKDDTPASDHDCTRAHRTTLGMPRVAR